MSEKLKRMDNDVEELLKTRRLFLGFIFTALALLHGCNQGGHERWAGYSADFRVLSDFPHRFVPVDEDRADERILNEITSLPDTDTSILNQPVWGQYSTSKAYGRIPLGGEWWGLIVLHGPGEASNSLQHYLLPFDTVSGKWGRALLLSEHWGECGYKYVESVVVEDSVQPIILQFASEIMIPNDVEGCNDLKPLKWSIGAFGYDGPEPKRVEAPIQWNVYADETAKRVRELYFDGKWESAFRSPSKSDFER